MTTRDILALTMVKGIGNAFIKRNINHIALSTSLLDFIRTSRIILDDEEVLTHYLHRADSILEECEDKRYKVVDITEDAYPKALKEINDPPAILYMLGNTSLLDATIAIVGTRHSTELGNKIAERLGRHFSNHYAICNGLVEGIDEHSILFAGKMSSKVIGVISGGLNYHDTCTSYHARIINEVLDAGGLIISEFEPSQKEDQFSGSKVSRIQAGLSSGLILVQSSINGGSKYTLKAFSKLGRTIGVIHFPGNSEYQGDSFSANRIISEKGIEGLAQFIGQKSAKSLYVKSIITIQGQNDYETFLRSLQDSTSSLW